MEDARIAFRVFYMLAIDPSGRGIAMDSVLSWALLEGGLTSVRRWLRAPVQGKFDMVVRFGSSDAESKAILQDRAPRPPATLPQRIPHPDRPGFLRVYEYINALSSPHGEAVFCTNAGSFHSLPFPSKFHSLNTLSQSSPWTSCPPPNPQNQAKMKFAGLALVALTGLATAVPIAQEPAADPGPDYSYYNRFCVNDWANLQTCNLDNHFQSCNNGIATVYTCVDGCHRNCPPKQRCSQPTCNGAEPLKTPRTGIPGHDPGFPMPPDWEG